MFTAVLGLLFASCVGRLEKKYTVGVVNYMKILDPVLDGFKARMAELGYVEGQSVTYVYHGAVAPDPKVVESEVRGVLAQKVDLLLTMGTLPTRVASRWWRDTNVPVVFSPVISPVDEGLVRNPHAPAET